jgi:hypothetical protein
MHKLLATLWTAVFLATCVADSRMDTYVVDRIEDGEIAVLVRDADEAIVEMPASDLPSVEEGAIYRWGLTWTRDRAEESRRLAAARAAYATLTRE